MIYFTADTHFGDSNLVRTLRYTFNSTGDHDEYLISRINNKVKRNDTLVILGDFGKPPGRYRPRIDCRHIFFILGNHDQETKIRCVFGQVWHYKTVKLTSGQKVWCCHFPTAFWDGSHNGTYHAYGHIHYQPMLEAMLDSGLPKRRSMDVGVEAAKKRLGDYEPFSETEFLSFLAAESGHDLIVR